jgi:hypothetical protein
VKDGDFFLEKRVLTKNLFCVKRAHAKNRRIAWELSLDEFTNVCFRKCYLCNGEPISAFKGYSKYRDNKIATIKYQGIDRIDNAIGYIVGNVRPCCTICNMMKNEFSFRFFKLHLLKIINFKKWGE